MSRRKLTPAGARIIDYLRDHRLSAMDHTSVNCASPDTLKVQISYLRAAGYSIVTETEDGKPWPRGAIRGFYRLTIDPDPPYANDYVRMANSMGISL